MSSAVRTEVFECNPDQFYEIITDFPRYHEFLPEVRQCKVLESNGKKKLVQFEVSVIKTFTYRLWMTMDPPHNLSWTLDGGDLFKLSNGSWKLEPVEGDKTRATYFVEGRFKIFIPSVVEKNLLNNNLPRMFKNYHERVAKIYPRASVQASES